MERIVVQRHFPKANLPQRKRVAAYARVSSGKDAMLHSLSAQVSYYSEMIQHHSGWEYVGVYADEAKTGTRDSRENFQRMLDDCRSGMIDMVITKSISRFARNTVTLLETVRELKSLGVDVFFEEQNIHSLSSDGELMLSILASYAQEESLSASENQKWRIRRNFENGMPWNGTMLGYRYDKGVLIVEPEEEETVKRIYSEYLSGSGMTAIAKRLNADGILTRYSNAWGKASIKAVLQNYAYTGNLLLQTSRRVDHLTKRDAPNNGELPQYYVEGCHEAIIPLRLFNAVQEEMKRRAEKHTHPGVKRKEYPFTGKLICTCCGKHYRRKITATGPKWICTTYNTHGKAVCPSKAIPEQVLEVIADEIGGIGKITALQACKDNALILTLTDGTQTVKQWQDRSRRDSWTKEMKETARQKAKERRVQHG